MKAVEAKLLAFLKKSPQFVIPIYQRTYSWTERECRQLWNDVLRAGRSPKVAGHFVGSIVYVEKGLYTVTTQSPLLVIDGQQRLTTVSLLILALTEALGAAEPLDGFSAKKLRHYYLVNSEEEGERYFKLILSQADKATLKALVEGSPLPEEPSIRVKENLDLFRAWIAEAPEELTAICEGLAKLMVVDISLDRDQDNPQLIFESMNSTGLELSQADLIRNFILMGLNREPQERLYEHYWRPMEREFGQRAYSEAFDGFMRNFLTLKTGGIPKKEHVYREFKRYAQSLELGDEGVEALVKDIRTHATFYCRMALYSEPDPGLRAAFKDLRELKVEVAFPLLLELYGDYAQGLLSKEHFLEALRMVESYVFRRAVCEIPTNSLDKTFATFMKAVQKDRYLDSFKAQFLTLPSYRRFPKEDEFKRALQERDMYHFRRGSYWLRRLENHGRKEPISVEEYTIEHIMPQNENVSEAWRRDLGGDWQRIHETYLHRLGNLTLTGYNSEYSDRPFREKRDMEGGFRESPLRVNRGIAQVDLWNEAAILQRGGQLAEQCCAVWSAPVLDAETLALFSRRTGSAGSSYSIADHPHVASGAMANLFQVIRQDILALDPCVTEEFLKLYIAYKAETNFVDIVPQASRLRLSINIPYPELDDPKGLARDVTELGRWGNGDVELGISTEAEIPYAMGLIRQAFERQFELGDNVGNGDNGRAPAHSAADSPKRAGYRAFFQAVQAKFLELCPQAKPGTVSGKHYHQIPIGISGIHYEWWFHARPQESFGIELHFESRDAELNRVRISRLQQRFLEWRDGLPPDAEVHFSPDWSADWTRLYFLRPMPDYSPESAIQAAEDMAAFYRCTIPILWEPVEH